jgi:hypothetical protein
MKLYDEKSFWEVLEAKVMMGVELSPGEIDLEIAYIIDERADKQGYAEALEIINRIKNLQD